MARLIYLRNPSDRTTTWYGRTYTWEFLEYCHRMQYNPWLGVNKRTENV